MHAMVGIPSLSLCRVQMQHLMHRQHRAITGRTNAVLPPYNSTACQQCSKQESHHFDVLIRTDGV